jgi:hypothetical protein
MSPRHTRTRRGNAAQTYRDVANLIRVSTSLQVQTRFTVLVCVGSLRDRDNKLLRDGALPCCHVTLNTLSFVLFLADADAPFVVSGGNGRKPTHTRRSSSAGVWLCGWTWGGEQAGPSEMRVAADDNRRRGATTHSNNLTSSAQLLPLPPLFLPSFLFFRLLADADHDGAGEGQRGCHVGLSVLFRPRERMCICVAPSRVLFVKHSGSLPNVRHLSR